MSSIAMRKRARQYSPIIVVEDNDEDFYALTRFFKKENCPNPIVRYSDGESCLDKLISTVEIESSNGPVTEEAHPCLILLDLNLPGTDGHAVLKRLKSHAKTKQIPITILTSSSREQDVRECYESGANAYMLKPVDYGEYSQIMSRMATFWLETVELP